MVRFSVLVLASLGVFLNTSCDEQNTAPLGDSGGVGTECRDALARWDAAHPLPDATLTVVLDGRLITGPGGTSPDPGADGSNATLAAGTVPRDIIVEFTEPIDVRGIRHYPAPSGNPVSHYEVFLGDDTGCDEYAGEAVVDLGPFYQDDLVNARVASRVRISVLEVHGGGTEFTVADFEILAGADFETTPATTIPVEVPWTWDAQARIPGVGPITWSLTTSPIAMNLDDTGLLTWTPHLSQVGPHMVNVVARRGDASIEKHFVLTVEP